MQQNVKKFPLGFVIYLATSKLSGRFFSNLVASTKYIIFTHGLNPEFFAAQIQISIQNKYLGFGYKCLVFCRINGKHRQGNLSTKISADEPAENTPNDPKFLSKSKSLGFR